MRSGLSHALLFQGECTGPTARCAGSAVPVWMARSRRTSSPQVGLAAALGPPVCLQGWGESPSVLRQEPVSSADFLQGCRPQTGSRWMPSAGKYTGQTREPTGSKWATWTGPCGRCWCGRTLTARAPSYCTTRWGESGSGAPGGRTSMPASQEHRL